MQKMKTTYNKNVKPSELLGNKLFWCTVYQTQW